MSRFLVLALIAAALATSMTSAETIIPGGNVSGLWNSAGSPYLIQGNITIPAHETLIIEPGVSVIFQGTYGWIVQGWLEAIGTATDSILITAQDTTHRWYGIKFDNAPDSSDLEYCIIEYGKAWPYVGGGGIYSLESNPVISHCTLRYNLGYDAGAIFLSGSSPRVTYNDISHNGRENITWSGGGINVNQGCHGIIAFNFISDNCCKDNGGGISLGKGNVPFLYGNYVIGNRDITNGSGNGGGGLSSLWESVNLRANIIADNSTDYRGGGLLGEFMLLNKSIIYNNEAVYGGGVLSFYGSTFTNSILYHNAPDQIYGHPQYTPVTYSDVQNGWPGLGNIASDPMFVAPEYYDFRLQWGSPCIDAGDPDPQNNDPDGTRGDMGYFYYDQSIAVRVLLTPHERSIVIPSEGGSFDYTLWLTNINPSNPTFTLWCDITLPNGTIFGPVPGPLTAQLDSGVTISRVRSQMIPARALKGVYSYNAYAVVSADTSRDSFSFFKMEPAQAGGIAGWKNAGEALDNLGETHLTSSVPANFSLEQNYPNPFNPATTLSFLLPVPSYVSLKVYDTAGRLVEFLVNGWRLAGSHQVTWNASGLPSGLYFCRMQAGDFSAVRKMMLVK